jgi:hypothetical protein
MWLQRLSCERYFRFHFHVLALLLWGKLATLSWHTLKPGHGEVRMERNRFLPTSMWLSHLGSGFSSAQVFSWLYPQLTFNWKFMKEPQWECPANLFHNPRHNAQTPQRWKIVIVFFKPLSSGIICYSSPSLSLPTLITYSGNLDMKCWQQVYSKVVTFSFLFLSGIVWFSW